MRSWLLTLTALLASSSCSAQTTTYVISPSGYWDGPDGPWASFLFSAGTPLQKFRTFPALSFSVVVLPRQAEWCANVTSSVCEARGNYYTGSSSTWDELGLYTLPSAQYLPFDNESGIYGLDTFTFGGASNDIQLANQSFVTTDSREIAIGLFGLNYNSISLGFTPQKPLLRNLKDSGQIPSYSFSYTAGSGVGNSAASLVIGGYDASRFDAQTTKSFDFPSLRNTSFVVGIDSIIFGTDPPLRYENKQSKDRHFVPIDSSIAQIWLPLEICRVFEDVFHLTWDDSLQLYLINDTIHAQLLNEDTNVTFSLLNGGNDLPKNFTLSYSAFNLNATYPMVNTSSHYFPLKRATNPSQSVLGRTFLQEVYLTADYDRWNFSLSQAYPEGNARIFSIEPPSNSSSTSAASSKDGGLSAGAFAGIGVGVGFVVLGVASVLFAWRKKWGWFRHTEGQMDSITNDRFDKAELVGEGKERAEAMEKERAELETVERSLEVGGRQLQKEPVEMDTDTVVSHVRMPGAEQ